MNDTLKKILIVVGVLIVGGGIYFAVGQSDDDTASGLRSTTDQTGQAAESNAADQEALNREFVSTLLSLNALSLDGQIFERDAFEALQDYSVTLVPEGDEGRPNPFAPLGVDAEPATNEGDE